jgi:uncharacterized protein
MLRIAFMVAVLCLPMAASAQGFNCAYARQLDEIAICDSYELRSLDSRMVSIFNRLRASLNYNAALRLNADQTSWLADRNTCGDDRRCLREAYRRRIAQLLADY